LLISFKVYSNTLAIVLAYGFCVCVPSYFRSEVFDLSFIPVPNVFTFLSFTAIDWKIVSLLGWRIIRLSRVISTYIYLIFSWGHKIWYYVLSLAQEEYSFPGSSGSLNKSLISMITILKFCLNHFNPSKLKVNLNIYNSTNRTFTILCFVSGNLPGPVHYIWIQKFSDRGCVILIGGSLCTQRYSLIFLSSSITKLDCILLHNRRLTYFHRGYFMGCWGKVFLHSTFGVLAFV